ncbi:MAG: hypothetical protein J5838_00580 [Desulfovibrio sp.]|jgi:predicted transposase YdaD|nr:hypothetical protein [Desulfovibrio sp.]
MLEDHARQWTDELMQRGGMRGRLEGFRAGYLQGFKEGFRLACREVARNMLEGGQSEAEVCAVTGLSPDSIKKLALELSGQE